MAKAQKTTPRPGRPRDAAKDDAILAAAGNLFLEKGFEAASLDAIAAAAGVSKVTIYARFESKEALFRSVLAKKCDDAIDPAALEFEGAHDLRTALTDIARRFLSLILDPESLALHRVMAIQGDTRMASLFFENAVGNVRHKVTRFIEAECRYGHLKVRDPEGAAWRFLGALKAEAHMRAMLGLPPIPKRRLEKHIEACVGDFLALHARREG